jgi:iron complex outermembrane receptor protein
MAGTALIVCATGGRALAADADQASAGSSADTLGEIIITAERTESTASKTPIALSVFTGEQLSTEGINNAQNLDQLAPGVTVANNNHGISISIRGVTTTDPTSKGTQDIAYSMDGIPVLRPEEMQLGFFDLERVEILRGPQGTLYGASSTAGAVNVISARPKGDFDAYATAEVGNYDTRRGTAMVNLPLTDNFWVRGAMNYNYRDGYLNPVLDAGSQQAEHNLDDEDNLSGRVTALWTISDKANLTLTGNFGHIGGTGSTNAMLWDRLNDSASDRFDVYYNPYAGVYNDRFANFNVELNWDFGPVRMTYDGAHFRYDGAENYNPSTSVPFGGTPSYSWSFYTIGVDTDYHEFRFSSTGDGPFSWVAGANYLHELNNEIDANWSSPVACSPSLASSCSGNPNPDIDGPNMHETKGIYGQLNYNVTDALKLTAGARWTQDAMYRHATLAAGGAPGTVWMNAEGGPCGPINGSCVNSNNGSILDDDGDEHDSKVTWRVAADYTLAPNQMLYAYVATGFKAGGFNDLDPTTTTHKPAPYGPEDNTAFEIGYKGKPTSNIQFTSDIYYYDYSKYQLTGATFLSPSVSGGNPLVLIYTTIVPVTIYGWENEVKWNATPNDIFDVSFVYENGYFNKGKDQAMVGFIYNDQIPWGGHRLDNMPKFSGTPSYEHLFNLTNGNSIVARVQSKISSGYGESDYGGSNPVPGPPPFLIPPGLGAAAYGLLPTQYQQKSYTRTNMDLSYKTSNGKFELGAYVRNLENKIQILGPPQNYSNSADGYPADDTTVRVSEPRTYGMRITVRY